MGKRQKKEGSKGKRKTQREEKMKEKRTERGGNERGEGKREGIPSWGERLPRPGAEGDGRPWIRPFR